MLVAQIVSFGFGRRCASVRTYENVGNSARDLGAAEALCLSSIPDADEFTRLVRSLAPSLIIMPPVSPYSHLAFSIWCSGIAVAAMERPERLAEGELIIVDFDSAQISTGGSECAEDSDNEPGVALGPANSSNLQFNKRIPRLYSEITSLADGEQALRDGAYGISIIKIEQLARDPTNEFVKGLISLSQRFEVPSQLKIRFYDDEDGLLNPFSSGFEPGRGLGLRGVRALSDLALQTRFAGQLNTLRELPITIVLPMVSTVDEARSARNTIATMSSAWSIGATIETPSAALLIEELIDELTFVELGLNDLSQYTLGWDRNVVNPELLPHDRVAPAVAKLVKSVFERCKVAGIECMLGLDLRPDLELAKQLASLGVDAVSCAPPLIRRWQKAWPAPSA